MFNILVAEDNADMRELFCTVLSDSGYHTIPASDGLDALEKMEQNYIDLIVAGSTVLNYDALTVTIHGRETILPQKKFYLLYKLLSYPNKIFTRQQLMDEIWGMFSETDERTVNTHINRLRERFRDFEDFEIVTVHGLGYKAVKHVG